MDQAAPAQDLPRLVVGAPVRAREWIIEAWFDHIEAAALEAVSVGVDRPRYVLVGDTADATFDLAMHRCAAQDRDLRVVHVDESGFSTRLSWGPDRYAYMADLRNHLLRQVRALAPMWFWSVDSDVLVHPKSLATAIEMAAERGFGAVGSRCYMSEQGTLAPSWGLWHPGAGGLVRYDHGNKSEAAIIMAVKLMTSAAYAVDYVGHHQGEDVGWSLACRAAGLKLGWDGSTVSKHVMAPDLLGAVDERCGW